MNEQEVSKEHMDSLKFLADTNMKIGIARQTLQNLEEAETEYLVKREEKAVLGIQKAFDDSKELLDGVRTNYAEVKALLSDASSFADFLVKAYEAFKALVADFDKRSEVWDAQVKDQEEEFARIREQIRTDKVRIENDRQAIESAKASLSVERRKLADERGTVERAISRLSKGKI